MFNKKLKIISLVLIFGGLAWLLNTKQSLPDPVIRAPKPPNNLAEYSPLQIKTRVPDYYYNKDLSFTDDAYRTTSDFKRIGLSSGMALASHAHVAQLTSALIPQPPTVNLDVPNQEPAYVYLEKIDENSYGDNADFYSYKFAPRKIADEQSQVYQQSRNAQRSQERGEASQQTAQVAESSEARRARLIEAREERREELREEIRKERKYALRDKYHPDWRDEYWEYLSKQREKRFIRGNGVLKSNATPLKGK